MPYAVEQQTDAQDWEAFRRLDRLADHWWWRPGWHPDRHYLTWYILFDQPDLAAYAACFQHALADLDYLDPVPPDGLHMTLQGVAFADEVPAGQVAAIGDQARARCADLAPFTLTIGPVNGHPGGTFLRATPWQPLADMRQRLREAIATVCGPHAVPDEPARFKPHISLTYCHAEVSAQDLVRRVAHLRNIPPITIRVSSVDLVELHRDGHAYRWSVQEHLDLIAQKSSPESRL